MQSTHVPERNPCCTFPFSHFYFAKLSEAYAFSFVQVDLTTGCPGLDRNRGHDIAAEEHDALDSFCYRFSSSFH